MSPFTKSCHVLHLHVAMLIAVHPLLFKFLVKGKVNLHRPVTAKFQSLLLSGAMQAALCWGL